MGLRRSATSSLLWWRKKKKNNMGENKCERTTSHISKKNKRKSGAHPPVFTDQDFSKNKPRKKKGVSLDACKEFLFQTDFSKKNTQKWSSSSGVYYRIFKIRK